MLSALILGFGWALTPWIRPTTLQDAWVIGALWVALTLAFEFLGGHFLFGKPWQELFADYNLFAGRIWVMVLIVTLMTPAIAFTTRRLSQGLSARGYFRYREYSASGAGREITSLLESISYRSTVLGWIRGWALRP